VCARLVSVTGERHHGPMQTGSVRLDRHARHILLKEIGGPGQARLVKSTVALVGVGGLGAPAALYLAAAGVGRLVLIDPDVVELSNLQRQILFKSDDVGVDKARAGKAALHALDPQIDVDVIVDRLDDDNCEQLIAGADLVLDGTDSFQTRFAVNRACHNLGVPLVSGAVGRWDGQVGVFASGQSKGQPISVRQPCYQCFVPELPPHAQTCAQMGIVGALTGVIGALMALEAIKIIAKAGDPLVSRVFLFDGLATTARTLNLAVDPACPVCGFP
jgi:molybdopterin-synthase adenylyltransferase